MSLDGLGARIGAWVHDMTGAARADEAAAASGATRTTAPDLGGSALDGAFAAPGVALFSNDGIFHADIEDYRSAAAVDRAMSDPLALPEGARPFGSTVVFRPALSNITASPAYLFRLARYTDRVVVAYSNAEPGQDLTPRPVDEVFGQPVPPALRGKIFASGDPGHRMVPWDRLADLFERQLAAMDGSEAIGGQAIDGASLTVMALSAGGVDAVETRRRLEASGRGRVIGRLINVGAPMRGAPVADESFFGLVARAFGCTGAGMPKAVRGLDPDAMRRSFSDRDQRLVDLAVTNTLEGPDGRDNAHPVFKMLETAYRLNPLNRARGGPSDGWVDLASMRFGRSILHLDKAYDHAGVGSDPAIIDRIATRLASG